MTTLESKPAGASGADDPVPGLNPDGPGPGPASLADGGAPAAQPAGDKPAGDKPAGDQPEASQAAPLPPAIWQSSPDRGELPAAILGIPFDNVTTAETMARIGAMIESRRPHYAATANVDFAVQAMEDIELRRILLEAHLVMADGMPLVWASRWLGNPLPERVTGSDLVPRLLAEAEQQGWRVFFLGGTSASVAAAAANATARHPRLQLVGAYSPPFKPLIEMNHEDILTRIRAAQPDILLVAFGCPKQEKWINMHYRAAGVPLSIGVGATIDFLAGTVSRAPRWMQRTGLEWVFRLLQEPRRLFRRYAKGLWVFGGGILRQWWRLRAGKGHGGEAGEATLTPVKGGGRLLRVYGPFDAAAVRRHRRIWVEALAAGTQVFADLSAVWHIDSTGVALLTRLQKNLRAAGRFLVLVAPSPAVRRALEMMRFTDFLPDEPSLDAARDLAAERATEQSVVLVKDSSIRGEIIAWQGEIVAANAESVWHATEGHLRYWSGRAGVVRINLAQVRFMDSTGVGLMVRARKFGRLHGLVVDFTEPTREVRQVVGLFRIGDYFFPAAR